MFRKQHMLHNELNKIALSMDDDKQIVQRDGMSMLVHGHKSITRYTT